MPAKPGFSVGGKAIYNALKEVAFCNNNTNPCDTLCCDTFGFSFWTVLGNHFIDIYTTSGLAHVIWLGSMTGNYDQTVRSISSCSGQGMTGINSISRIVTGEWEMIYDADGTGSTTYTFTTLSKILTCPPLNADDQIPSDVWTVSSDPDFAFPIIGQLHCCVPLICASLPATLFLEGFLNGTVGTLTPTGVVIDDPAVPIFDGNMELRPDNAPPDDCADGVVHYYPVNHKVGSPDITRMPLNTSPVTYAVGQLDMVTTDGGATWAIGFSSVSTVVWGSVCRMLGRYDVVPSWDPTVWNPVPFWLVTS